VIHGNFLETDVLKLIKKLLIQNIDNKKAIEY
jgi:hypothetical protein